MMSSPPAEGLGPRSPTRSRHPRPPPRSPAPDPVAEKRRQRGGEEDRLSGVGLDEQEVVNDAQGRDGVDEIVQALPPPPAEPADPSVGGGDRERYEQEER